VSRENEHYEKEDCSPYSCAAERDFHLYGGCIMCFAPKPGPDFPDICITCYRQLDREIAKLEELRKKFPCPTISDTLRPKVHHTETPATFDLRTTDASSDQRSQVVESSMLSVSGTIPPTNQ